MTAILVVEDDDTLRSVLVRGLRAHGYDVESGAGPDAALEMLQRREYDVLLTDLRLDDESGIDLIRSASTVSSRTRPLLMSAYATARDHDMATSLGAVRVLSKPFTIEELVVAVRHAVEAETGYRGSIHGLSLVDLLQMYHYGKRSIALATDGSAEIFLERGEIVHARAADLEGEPALRKLLARPGGAIRTGALPSQFPRTIDRGFDGLVLDALRAYDEDKKGEKEDDTWIDRFTFSPPPGSSPPPRLSLRTPRVSSVPPAPQVSPLDVPCANLVATLEGAVACAAVDLGCGMVLGAHDASEVTDGLVMALPELFRAASAAEGSVREMQINCTWGRHFIAALRDGQVAILLTTHKRTNIGAGWAALRAALPAMERRIP